MIKLQDLLQKINFDCSVLTPDKDTLGDSALGLYRDNSGNKFLVKKSKKENPAKAANTTLHEEEVIADILTEYFIGLLGVKIKALTTCDYFLGKDNGKLRILSPSFLKADESIFHGLELFADYFDSSELSDPRHKKRPTLYLVFHIEKYLRLWCEKYSRDPNLFQSIFDDFLKMCLWDAITGNNDRHLQNWGIRTSLRGNSPPQFTPIFDTARGLGWNILDKKIKKDPKPYVMASSPHIGIRLDKKINHFKFVRGLLTFYPYISNQFVTVMEQAHSVDIANLISSDVYLKMAMSTKRKDFIQSCYEMRLQMLDEVLNERQRASSFLKFLETLCERALCRFNQYYWTVRHFLAKHKKITHFQIWRRFKLFWRNTIQKKT